MKEDVSPFKLFSIALLSIWGLFMTSVHGGEVDDQASLSAEEIPECGVASVYCVLNLLDVEAPLEDIRQRFVAHNHSADLRALSMEDLRHVLSTYSLNPTVVRVTDRTVDHITPPAILYFPRYDQADRKDIGHFVVLESFDETKVRLLDLSLPENLFGGIATMDKDSLSKHWEGEAIVLDVNNEGAPASYVRILPKVLTPLLATIFVYLCVTSFNRKNVHAVSAKDRRCNGMPSGLCNTQDRVRASLNGALLLASLILLSASPSCSKAKQGTSDLPLVFAESNIDLGIVETSRTLRQKFTFRVWDQGPVKVIYASTSCCGPKAITPDIEGQTLEAGSEHIVELSVLQAHSGERRDIIGTIETDPPSPRPITFRLRATLKALPMVHPDPILMTTIVNEVPTGKVKVRRLRTSDMLRFSSTRTRLTFSRSR